MSAYPSSIFIRPRAIVVNLEHIKMIVVSSYALLLNTDSPEPHTRRFVQLLKQQLTPRSPAEQQQQQQVAQTMGGAGRIKRRHTDPANNATAVAATTTAAATTANATAEDAVVAAAAAAAADGSPSSRAGSSRPISRSNSYLLNLEADAIAAEAAADATDGLHDATTDLLGLKQSPSDLRILALPFELRVLEAALHDVCKRLLDETMALGGGAGGTVGVDDEVGGTDPRGGGIKVWWAPGGRYVWVYGSCSRTAAVCTCVWSCAFFTKERRRE